MREGKKREHGGKEEEEGETFTVCTIHSSDQALCWDRDLQH